MAASHDGPFAVDLRRLAAADAAAVRAASTQRYGSFYSVQNPLDAFDVLVHVPHVGTAEPDCEAIAASPSDVQEIVGRWLNR
jgi:erythromycin esterase